MRPQLAPSGEGCGWLARMGLADQYPIARRVFALEARARPRSAPSNTKVLGRGGGHPLRRLLALGHELWRGRVQAVAQVRRRPPTSPRRGDSSHHLSALAVPRRRSGRSSGTDWPRRRTSRSGSRTSGPCPSGRGPSSSPSSCWPVKSGMRNVGLAVPTGFEPAISSLTGTHVRPLHHGTELEGSIPHPELAQCPLPTVHDGSDLPRDEIQHITESQACFRHTRARITLRPRRACLRARHTAGAPPA
jgi:hypothetical protein